MTKKERKSTHAALSHNPRGDQVVFSIYDDGPSIPGWYKIKPKPHDFQGLCSAPTGFRWGTC